MENLHLLYMLLVCYLSYFLITWRGKIAGYHNLKEAVKTDQGFYSLIRKYVLGILILGLPFSFSQKYNFLVNKMPDFSENNIGIYWILLLFFSVAIASASTKKISFDITSSLSLQQSTDPYLFLAIRVLFLFIYELYFRGFLLFSLIPILGLTPAIIASTLLYAIQHIFDSKKELLSCIPFGICVCILSYLTLSIWPAFIIHSCIAVICEGNLLFKLKLKSNRI
ncbi:MAG: CPBP family intramembrane glutamic endopeptidase [Daejeonella sp.]